MSITSVVNDTVTSVSVINALKPLPPTITNYSVGGVDDTALDPAGGQTVQINGTGFLPGATITFDGSAVAVVTYVSPNRLTFTSPAKSAGTYTIYVVNSDGGTAIFIPGIIYSVLPTWTTSAGTLGSYYETTSISNTVVASGDAPITYSLYSGSLPTGSTLYANGVITGTAPVDSSSTTYSFTIEAIDAQLQGSTRSFSLTINVDAVTWVSPANNTTYTSAVDSAIANVTLSATDAAGYAVSYSANALPTGLSLSGANITGTPTVIADSSTLLTATAATTNRTATRTINWSITVANDPYFEYNTLLIPGASTTFVDDASTNNFAVTINGDTKPNNFNPYTPGYYSNYFDGGTNRLTTATSSLFNLFGANITLECWVYMTATPAVLNRLITIGPNSAQSSLYLGIDTNRMVNFSVPFSSGGNVTSGANLIPLNTWTHLAFVLSGSTGTLYINGTQVGQTTGWNITSTSSNYFYVGYDVTGTVDGKYTGYVSNVRLLVGTALYTSAFTPSTTPLTSITNTRMLTCQSNRFIDNSTNTFAITVFGNTTINSFDPFTPNTSYSTYGSGYFDGTGDYLTAGSSISLSGSFTIEGWVYITSTATNTVMFGIGNDRLSTGLSVFVTPAGQPKMLSNDGYPVVGSNGQVGTNQWVNIALVRNSTALTLYVNGTSVGTGTNSSTFSGTAYVGAENYDNTIFITAAAYLSDIRVGTTAVYTTAFTPPSAPLTAIANTSLLTLQNNQSVKNSVFLDNSTNNFLVTRNGNTTQGTFSPYGGNWSNYFDGSSYLIPASGINTAMGTGFAGNIISFEMWIYPTNFDAGGYGQGITGAYAAIAANGRWMIQLEKTAASTSKLNFAYTNSSSSQIDLSSTASAIIRNQWNHIAITIDATTSSSATIKMFANGSLLNTFTSQNMSSQTSYYRAPYIGGVNSSFVSNFYGNISNYRILKGSFAYTGNYTPPTVPLTAITNTQLLTCQSNRVIDNSINNFAITLTGTPIVQRFSPFSPSSVTPTSYSGYFDGTGDYLATTSTQIIPASTTYTVEAWVYFTGDYSDYREIVTQGSSGNANRWLMYIEITTGILRIQTGSPNINTSFTVPKNTWTHLAFVNNSGSYTVYANGTSVASGTNTVTPQNTYVTVGAFQSGAEYFQGYISNVRITNTAVYTSAFTPSTTPLTAISGTSLLTCQSPTFIDNSTNNFAITAFGNSQPTQQNPFGFTSATTQGYTVSTIGGSGYFDGTGDYLTMPTNSVFSLSGAFTFETWLYPTAFSNYKGFWSNTNTINSTGLHVGLNAAGNIFIYSNSSFVVTSSNAMSLNTWNHVAVVRRSGIVYIYINGVVSTNSWTTSTAFTNAACVIGTNPGPGTEYYFGYLSDARLLNGTALYTSNFVPPSQPLTAIQNTSLLTNMTSAGIYDAAMMTNMETIADSKLSTAISKFGGSSMYFDGTGDYITVSGNQQVTYSMGLGDFTVEMWVNAISLTSGGNLFDTNNAGDVSGAGRFGIELLSNNQVKVYIGTGQSIVTGGTINTGTWYHIAYSRASGSGKLFVNGIQVGSTYTDTNNYICGNLNRPVFGVNGYDNATTPYNGYIDDLRITKGYARYTANFTPPTTAFQLF